MTGGVKIPIEAEARSRIIQGFSAIFWGMPLALLTGVRCGLSNWLQFHDGLLPVAAFTLIASGVWKLSHIPETDTFTCRRRLETVKLSAAICAGLSPFIFFWNHYPGVTFFSYCITFLMLFALLLVLFLNVFIRKLAGIFSDETLTSEIGFFTRVNLVSLGVILIGGTVIKLSQSLLPESPFLLLENNIFFPLTKAIGLMFFLIPLSLTMTLIWKIKVAIINPDQAEQGVKRT